jgi:hypothetical protein
VIERTGRTLSRSCTAFAFAFIVALAFPVMASTVVLVRPPRPNAIAAEATIRLRGELVSAGFDVRVIDPPVGADIRSSLELAAAAPDVEAVVAILGEAMGVPFLDSAELWVIDRVTGKTVVRRVPNQPGAPRAAEQLSIRALELLRASFLEVALASNRIPKTTVATVAQPPAPVEVTRWTRDALEDAIDDSANAFWAIELGASALVSRDGLPTVVLPTLRAERRFGGAFLGRVTAAGLGTAARVVPQSISPIGTADVSQQFALLEAVLRFRVGNRIQPFLSLGAGGLHVSAKGESLAAGRAYRGIDGDRWVFLADAGAGLRFRIAGRFELSLDAEVQAANPYPVIRFNDTQIARIGRPTLLGCLAMVAWM